MDKVAATTVVAEDDVWLRRSWSAAGELVDDPPPTYRIPIDAAAVDPATFATFVPAADRARIAALAQGEAILGATSAGLRGLGPGAVIAIGDRRIRIAAVLPDELVGAAELVVSRRTGARIGITHDRYFLVQPAAGRHMTAAAFRARLQPLLPTELGVNRAVQVRAPGQTPFFRAGDAVLPPVIVKSLFGEFAARPGARPGTIEIDPAWMASHLETTHLPVLGRVTCNVGIIDQLRGAMRTVEAAGLSSHRAFVQRLLRAAAHRMERREHALLPLLGHRLRREPRRQLPGRDAPARPATRADPGAMGVPVGRHVDRARREPLRVPPHEGVKAPYRVGRLRRESASIVTAPRSTSAVTMNWVDASNPTRPMPL